jgi:hypothetical protein
VIVVVCLFTANYHSPDLYPGKRVAGREEQGRTEARQHRFAQKGSAQSER